MNRLALRCFRVASWLLVLTAVAHTLGHFQPPPADERTAAVLAAMRGYTMEMGLGMVPSLYDVQQALSLTMTITLLLWGVQNLLVARGGAPDPRTVRTLSWVGLVGSFALVVLYARTQIPPPLICFVLVAVGFLASLVAGRGSRSAADPAAG